MIIQVITEPVAGGAEVLVRETHRRYLASGVSCEVVYFNSGDHPLSQGEFAFETGLRSPLNILKLRRTIKARAKGREPVIVHAHLTWPFVYVALATMFLNVRLFYTEHSTHNKRRNSKVFRFLDRLIYARYDRIICISQGVCQSLADWVGPRLARKLVVIPNGAKLYPLVNRAAPVGRKLRLVSVGSLHARKNFSTAIAAVARIRDCVEEYVIVGEGPERPVLERLIAEHDLQQVVQLAGWSDNVGDYLTKADVQLIPSLWEGFGLVAVEGMSTGLPVIASDVDGLREVLLGAGDSVCLLPDTQSVRAWASAITEMSGRLQPETVGSMAASSRAQAERFSLDRMVEQYLAEYAGL